MAKDTETGVELKLDAGAREVSLDDIVTFEFAYPKEYKKEKRFKDGDKIKLHSETAKQFKEMGIGKIVA